jgi:hypothetical protein
VYVGKYHSTYLRAPVSFLKPRTRFAFEILILQFTLKSQDIQNQIDADNAAITTDEGDIASLRVQLQTVN